MTSITRVFLWPVIASAFLSLFAPAANAQRSVRDMARLLEGKVLSPEVTASELQRYALGRIAKLPPGANAESWRRDSAALRETYLRDIVFRGWPGEWVNAPLRIEDRGMIGETKGYRVRKLRFEIVPDFWGVALLYEPARLEGRLPAVLNVDGHDAAGKSAEYKQKRCINQALRGMLSLNIEFLGFGEMAHPENVHQSCGPHLDLVGANAVGLFYLAMRKGLDFLDTHPNVDRSRIAMTGLSGGGWQTSVLSSLDERVAVAIPVAGHAPLRAQVEANLGIGDIEQTPTDMQTVLDYAHLNAMRAPRPTLLIYNAEDDCCFRAPLVKESTYEEIRPFFRMYSAESKLAWHINTDPGYHNYQVDNRQMGYRFLAEHFGIAGESREIPVHDQLRTHEELLVGLPSNNLTMLGVARRLASKMERAPKSAQGKNQPLESQRDDLRATVRARPTRVEYALPGTNTYNKGVETTAIRFVFANGLSASGIWLRLTDTPDGAPATLLLNDKGKTAVGAQVFERLFRGEQVLAADLLFFGDAEPPRPGTGSYMRLLYTLGDRPIGVQSAQLAALGAWLREKRGAPAVRLEVDGLRSHAISVVTTALNPGTFTALTIRNGGTSLGQLLEAPILYAAAPELFCLGLYPRFDLDSIEALGAPTRVTRR